MKKFIKYTSIILSLLLSSTLYAAKNAQPLDSIVAIVNDGVVTSSELKQSMQLMTKQMQGAHVPIPPQQVMRKQALDQLINKKLQFQLAQQMGIKISPAEVDKTISSIAKDNKMPVSELYKHIAEQGLTVAQYRQEITDQLTIQKVQQHSIGNKISISPEEVTAFMQSKKWQAFSTKEYHLEDLLIPLPDKPSTQDMAEARKKADSLSLKIHSGKMNFHEAAASEQGDKNPVQEGDLGWRKLPEIPTAFSDRILNMSTNEVSRPIQTPNGYHIVRLVGVRSIGKTHAADERRQVEQLIFQRKAEETLQTWMTKLRGEAFIKIEG